VTCINDKSYNVLNWHTN